MCFISMISVYIKRLCTARYFIGWVKGKVVSHICKPSETSEGPSRLLKLNPMTAVTCTRKNRKLQWVSYFDEINKI